LTFYLGFFAVLIVTTGHLMKFLTFSSVLIEVVMI